MRLSYSALETFQTCPLKFKFREIDKIKTPKSKDAVFGIIIHDTLRMLHNPSRLVPVTEEELLQYFTENWDSSVWQDNYEDSAAFALGIKMLKNYYKNNHPSKFNIVDLETRFEAPILDRKQDLHIITGKIDRIDKLEDGIFEVIDYKTTKKMPAQKHADENLQLDVYHLGIVNRWPSLQKPEIVVKLSLLYLKHGEKLSTVKNSGNLTETKEKILEIIEKIDKKIKENKLEPQPNILCNWCEFQSLCPLFRHKYRRQEPDYSQKDIENLVKEFLELKEKSDSTVIRMAEIKSRINKYCDQQNFERIFSEDGYITRLPQKRFKYDEKKLKEILKPLGKWNEILIPDINKLKKIISFLPRKIQKQIEESKTLDKEFKTISIIKNKKAK